MLAKNFKFLMKYFGDTQEVLAKMFYVPQSNISEYQNGKKTIPIDVLEKISDRYRVSIDDLTRKDLSLEYELPQEIDLNTLRNIGENIFPILTSNVAKTNEKFNRAYDIVLSSMQAESLDMFRGRVGVMEHAITLFQQAWDESKTYVALSNAISVVLLIFVLYSKSGLDISQAMIDKGMNAIDIRRIILCDPNAIQVKKHYVDRQKAFYEEYEEVVYSNIRKLKENTCFSELGDYYLAMCYFLGFVDEDVKYETCVQVGICMLMQLCKLENKYAERFIEIISEIS